MISFVKTHDKKSVKDVMKEFDAVLASAQSAAEKTQRLVRKNGVALEKVKKRTQ